MNDIILFSYQSKEVRVTKDENGDPIWNAKDVCEILEIDVSQTRRLDEDEKGLREIQTPGGPQNMVFVTEPGLYSMIIRSNKPEAKKFKRWITHEVIPQLRKTGFYDIQLTNLKTLTFIQSEADAAVRLAETFGFDGNQALLERLSE
jgi:prophage antirepressor-like protein